MLGSELASPIRQKQHDAHQLWKQLHQESYLSATKLRQNKVEKQWNSNSISKIPKLEETSRFAQETFGTDELTAVYFYVSLVGNLGLFRRTLIQDVFKVR